MRDGVSRTAAVCAALLLLPAVTACRAPVRPYACAISPGEARVDPHQSWRCHRDIARRAAKRKDFSLREFREAADFFERLTGIPAASSETKLGPVPTKQMKQVVKQWDAWYEANGERLY